MASARVSEYMKRDIKAYLDDIASKDDYFALCYEDDSKSIDECCDFIVTQVQKSRREGFHDDEIYALATHYYREDNPGEIRKGAMSQCASIVINHPIQLTEEEKEEAKRRALEEITAREVKRLQDKEKREREAAKAKAEERKKQEENEGVLSLF